jgi:hypothetical protein
MSETSPTDSTHPDDGRTDERATLLPEEQAAGRDDPQAQARAILEDSDARTADPEGTKHDTGQTPDRSDH